MKTKLFALILALVFIAGALASCTDGKPGDDTKDEPASSAPTEGGTAEEKDEIGDYVREIASEVDFSGRTFAYIGKDDTVYSNFPVKEQETGDISSDALYFRQRDIEEYFGVTWESVRTKDGDETGERVINEVTAGGNSYDLAHGSTLTVGQFLLNAAVIRSADELQYVDLDRDWWISAMQDCYSIGGRQFFLTGPIVVNNYLDSTCVLFNKNVTAMFGISDDELYETVRDGKWTIDKMFGIASVIPENTAGVAGNGIWRYQQPDGISFIMSSGMKLTQFDEEGYPYVESSLQREISDLADKICPVFSDNSQTIFVYIAKGERDEEKYGTDHLEQFFIDDRVLFRFNVTHDVISMRTNDVRFGVLPMPKYNENQKNYSTWAAIGWDSAVYIPKTVDSIRFTDVILEAMGALGEKYIKDAYYDRLLRSQSIFDLDSRDMLDIIFSTKVYDMAGLYDNGGMSGYGDFLNAINNGIVYDSGNLASGYKGNARYANYMAKNLRKTVDKTE